MRDLIGILTREENVRMQYEILIMLLAFSVPALKMRDRRKLAAVWAGAVCIFLYLHRILLPVLVTGAYLYLMAGLLCVIACLRPGAFLLPAKAAGKRAREYLDPGCARSLVVFLLVWMIQAARTNIALDYDSLRYGLRSDVLLTGGHGLRGFFENTGLVNLVYSYPKGFEVLTRPLYFGHTWGYVLAANLWVLAAVLFTAAETVYEMTSSRSAAAFAAGALALMPGITNMAVTAKSDLATLLCQLVFLYCVARYIRESAEAGKERDDIKEGPSPHLVGAGVGALLFSYSFKPTALIFSSLLGLAALAFLLRSSYRIHLTPAGLREILLPAAFTFVVTLRTWLVTGMPYTSLFTGIFERLGMQLKYPLRIQHFSFKASEGLAHQIRFYLGRLLGLLFCPVGEDMAHVRMAWGGLAFLLMLVLIPVFYRRAPEQMEELNRLERIGLNGIREGGWEQRIPPAAEGRAPFAPEALRLTACVTAVVGAVDLASLYLLYQIDGNYYMLLYALAGILGCSLLYVRGVFETSPAGRGIRRLVSGEAQHGLLFLAAVMIYFTAFTGWAGPVGFTPVDPLNRGYYNHEAELPIQNPLSWDRHTRVIAFAGEPECYLLKGRVESWVDLDGSGGNVYLTDTKLNIFKEYMSFAGIDYVYADLHFLQDREDERHSRANTLFIYMLEDGDFEDIGLAEGSSRLVFARVDKERMSVGWEEPLAPKKEARTREQCAWFESIGGYR